MQRLPHWVVTDKFPSLYDVESATAIEQTAKVYGAMNALIDEYNKFVDSVNAEIEKFENDTTANLTTFKVGLRQEFQDFIDIVNLKMMSLEKQINDAENYMKTNIVETTTNVVNEALENHEIEVATDYNEETKEVRFVFDNGGDE